MIHSASLTVPPVAYIVFSWNLFCFEKLGRTDGRTDGRTACAKTMITTSRDCGSARWINTQKNGSEISAVFGGGQPLLGKMMMRFKIWNFVTLCRICDKRSRKTNKTTACMWANIIHVQGPIGQGGRGKKNCFIFTTYEPNFPGGVNKIFRQGGILSLTPPLCTRMWANVSVSH